MQHIDYMSWVIIPGLIFLARLLDVSMATVRHILANKGMRRAVPIIGFFEVLIWLVAITQVMQNLDNIASYLGWAFGFSAGTYLGIVIEEKLALGYQIVRIFTQESNPGIPDILRKQHFGVTTVAARGAKGPVDLVFVVTRRNRLPLLLSTLKTHAPNLFFTIEDVRKVDAGFFPKTIPIPESESAPDKAATDTGNPSAESDLIADATGSPQS